MVGSLLFLVFLSSCVLVSNASRQEEEQQNVCSCGTNVLVYDPLDQCLNMPSDVMFTRYICPVVNASGTFQFCGSSYCLGDLSCNVAGGARRRADACKAIGGSSVSLSFICRSGIGANQTETDCQFLPPLLPVPPVPTRGAVPSIASIPTMETDAPTSTGNALGSSLVFVFLLGLASIAFLF